GILSQRRISSLRVLLSTDLLPRHLLPTLDLSTDLSTVLSAVLSTVLSTDLSTVLLSHKHRIPRFEGESVGVPPPYDFHPQNINLPSLLRRPEASAPLRRRRLSILCLSFFICFSSSPWDGTWRLDSSFGLAGSQWRHQFGLVVRAQPAWWSRGCGLSEILAYEVSESLVDQSSMADTAMSLEASLCLSGLSLRKIKVFESFTVRICLVSPTWRNGSALRILGQVLLPGLGRWFRVLIESVEALPARRPSGILAIPVLCWPVGRTQSFVPWWCFAAACLSRVARCCVVLTLAACRVVCSFSLLSIRFVPNDQWRAQARRSRLTLATLEVSFEFRLQYCKKWDRYKSNISVVSPQTLVLVQQPCPVTFIDISSSVASSEFLASASEKAFLKFSAACRSDSSEACNKKYDLNFSNEHMKDDIISLRQIPLEPPPLIIFNQNWSLLNDWRCFFNSFPCSLSFPNHSSVCFFNLQPH
ncbi:hypothetical protein HID58_065346, partial [Brassica napus]